MFGGVVSPTSTWDIMADCSSEDEEDFVSEDKLLVVDSEEKWKELMCIEFPGIFYYFHYSF